MMITLYIILRTQNQDKMSNYKAFLEIIREIVFYQAFCQKSVSNMPVLPQITVAAFDEYSPLPSCLFPPD